MLEWMSNMYKLMMFCVISYIGCYNWAVLHCVSMAWVLERTNWWWRCTSGWIVWTHWWRSVCVDWFSGMSVYFNSLHRMLEWMSNWWRMCVCVCVLKLHRMWEWKDYKGCWWDRLCGMKVFEQSEKDIFGWLHGLPLWMSSVGKLMKEMYMHW